MSKIIEKDKWLTISAVCERDGDKFKCESGDIEKATTFKKEIKDVDIIITKNIGHITDNKFVSLDKLPQQGFISCKIRESETIERESHMVRILECSD